MSNTYIENNNSINSKKNDFHGCFNGKQKI